MLLCDIDEHLHLLVAQHNAGRVAGIRDHDGARVLVDERFDLLAVSVAIPLLRAVGIGRIDAPQVRVIVL